MRNEVCLTIMVLSCLRVDSGRLLGWTASRFLAVQKQAADDGVRAALVVDGNPNGVAGPCRGSGPANGGSRSIGCCWHRCW